MRHEHEHERYHHSKCGRAWRPVDKSEHGLLFMAYASDLFETSTCTLPSCCRRAPRPMGVHSAAVRAKKNWSSHLHHTPANMTWRAFSLPHTLLPLAYAGVDVRCEV